MTLTSMAQTATRQVKDVAQETSRQAGSVASRITKRDVLAIVAIAVGGLTLYEEFKSSRDSDGEPGW